jgi:hypothetical protein
MSIEEPSNVPANEPEKKDVNAINFLIDGAEKSLEALERQHDAAPISMRPSILHQIDRKKEELAKLREQLSS